jgi:predicted lipoprotein with Yx(FWY)xxD motif
MKTKVAITVAIAIATAAVASMIIPAGLAGASNGPATVAAAQTSLGRVLVDSRGRTLYLFARDSVGKSKCYGGCASYWPPLITSGKPLAKSGARASLLGRTKRRDGRWQVTYKGHPLYRFSGDTGKGQTSGEGLTDFGGEWDAVSPAGAEVSAKPSGRHGY